MTRCASPARSKYSARARRRSLRSAESAGVRRSACSASSTASRAAPRAVAAADALATVAASSSSGPSVASARCRARSSSSATASASARCNSRRVRDRERLLATAPSSGCEARTRSPSTTSTPASTASSTASALASVVSSEARRSALSATASSRRRIGAGSCATRVPRMSSIASGTGIPSPFAGSPSAASVRPSSKANIGLPSVDSWSRRRRCRGRFSPSRSARRRRVAPRLSGPTSTHVVSFRSSAALDCGGGTEPPREQKGHALVLEPPARERQHLGGRSVDPLDVVDRDDEAAAPGQRAQPVQEAERDRMGIGRSAAGLLAKQGDLQGTELGSRQAELTRVDAVEEIDQRREGQLRLRLTRSRREDAHPALLRSLYPGLPERRLADARLAREDERRARARGIEKRPQRFQLGLASGQPRLDLFRSVRLLGSWR